MVDTALGSVLLPYMGNVLLGFLPLVFLYQAIKATFPFRWYAVLWYVGVVVGVLVLVDANIPDRLSNWTGHSTALAIGFVLGAIWWVRPRRRAMIDGA